jgi:hypothetical protein
MSTTFFRTGWALLLAMTLVGNGGSLSQSKAVSWSTFSMGYQQSVTQSNRLRSVTGQLFVDEASQTQGGVASGFLADTLLAPIPYSAIIQLISGWNLISIPVGAQGMPKEYLFPLAASHAFAYTGTYVQANSMRNGVGYWLKFSSNQLVGLVGDFVSSDTIYIRAGWNMIGTLSESIRDSTISSIPPALVVSGFFKFVPTFGYFRSDTLMPGLGYWVKSQQAGWLILNNQGGFNPVTKIRIAPDSEFPPPPPLFTDTDEGLNLPGTYALEQNYPNPFNPTTLIHYQLPVNTSVTLKLFDLLGQEVRTLVDEIQSAGYKSVAWNSTNNSGNQVATGVYFYRLQTKEYVKTMKLLLMK